MRILTGHVSQETAYIVEGYPSGFGRKCKKRYWIERREAFGDRLWTQTSIPPGNVKWNQAKAGRYSPHLDMYLDDSGRVQVTSVAGDVAQFVMRAVGFPSGRPCPFAGQYLKSMDFDAHGGLGDGEFTDRVEEAKHFASQAAALAFWRTASSVRPLRDDGEPNRPLTSTTVQIEPLIQCVKGEV